MRYRTAVDAGSCLYTRVNSSTSSAVRAHEASIQYLADETGASLEETRVLFDQEFARLAHGATVRAYLHVLATSNVRALLGRVSRRAGSE